MEPDLKGQTEIYEQQQTVSGKQVQGQLDRMCKKLNAIKGVHVQSGTLTPVRNAFTGEITSYIER